MSKQHHYLKTETQYYQASERGEKYFEIRNNDRNFKVGDMVYLQEVVNGILTGRELPPREIMYILQGGVFGISNNYCIMQLK